MIESKNIVCTITYLPGYINYVRMYALVCIYLNKKYFIFSIPQT